VAHRTQDNGRKRVSIRPRTFVFILFCLFLWGVQLAAIALLWVWGERWGSTTTHNVQLVGFAATLLLGVLLVLCLSRALRLRARRARQPSREVLQERQRIARDLHDQVGSRLLGAMGLMDRTDARVQPLAEALERCLLELRLVVDSMDGEDEALADRLARLRHRLQPVLERRGLALRWQVEFDPRLPWPEGKAARDLAAIAQEALSNALQHSQASELMVKTAFVTDTQGHLWWCLQISDNGRGLAPGALAHRGGRGLENMRRRAEGMGAQLDLRSPGGQGLCVQVMLPGHSPAQATPQAAQPPA